jgi:hypothetical protein
MVTIIIPHNPSREKRFFSSAKVQTGYGSYPASYSMGTRGLFPSEYIEWGCEAECMYLYINPPPLPICHHTMHRNYNFAF